VRLDIFMKLANLKAALPSQGSLMHYLALVAESHSLELVTLSQQWTGISAAAEVSLKQITIDFNQLDAQVNKMNAEFIRIKDGKENVGLDGKLEDARGHCTNPLHKRLDKFLKEAKPRVVAIKDLSKSVEAAVERVMNQYGESLKGLSEEDPCKKFFGSLNTFGRQLGAAYDDNRTARELAEKAAKALADAEAKKQAQASQGPAGPEKEDKTKAALSPAAKKKPAGAVDNIFGNFHNSQKASADDVMEEFKRKMLARQNK
jgi:cell pole-organizing protein PopZ